MSGRVKRRVDGVRFGWRKGRKDGRSWRGIVVVLSAIEMRDC